MIMKYVCIHGKSQTRKKKGRNKSEKIKNSKGKAQRYELRGKIKNFLTGAATLRIARCTRRPKLGAPCLKSSSPTMPRLGKPLVKCERQISPACGKDYSMQSYL